MNDSPSHAALDPREKDIIEGLQSGKESAYRQLFELYYRQLVVFAFKFLDDLEAARDIVQESYLRMYESRRSISIQASLRSYLFSSVRNRCLNHIKHEQVKKRYRHTIRKEANPADTDLGEMMDAIELEARVFEIISKLPDRCGQIFIMSRVDGKRNREIAEELNISIRTVETQISRAIKSLRDNLLPPGE